MTVFAISISLTLLLLVVAVIGLFAMMGELAARVDGSTTTHDDDATVVPAEDARIGVRPGDWPEGLADIADADTGVVLVLSPLCASCNRIAPTIPDHPALRRKGSAFALVVSCSSQEDGTEFVSKYGLLDAMPTALDVNGEWLTNELGIDMSPSVLVFDRGRLRSAAVVASLAGVSALTEEIESRKEDDDTSQLATA